MDVDMQKGGSDQTVQSVVDPLAFVRESFERSFQDLASELTARHPEAHFSAQCLPAGTATTFQGYTLFVECCWPGRDADEPDNILLEVELCHLASTPRVNADICWGHGAVEMEFASGWSSSDEWPVATLAVLEQLAAKMPGMIDEFRKVVARGWPGTEPRQRNGC